MNNRHKSELNRELTSLCCCRRHSQRSSFQRPRSTQSSGPGAEGHRREQPAERLRRPYRRCEELGATGPGGRLPEPRAGPAALPGRPRPGEHRPRRLHRGAEGSAPPPGLRQKAEAPPSPPRRGGTGHGPAPPPRRPRP